MRSFGKNDRGVTIIELLLVVVVLAVIAGFAIPQMQKVALRQEFASEVDAAIDDFRIAQSWARNSILEQNPSQSVVAYQIAKDTNGFTRRQLYADGTDKLLSTVNLAKHSIEVMTWPASTPNGFEFKVPSGRTAKLSGEVLLDESIVVVFRHTRLNENISVTIDPSGTISR